MDRKLKNKLKTTIFYEFYINWKRNISKKMIQNNPQRFIEKAYKKVCGRHLNLEDPRLFTEKIQWMKLYDEMEIQTICADKVKVRNWIRKQIGEGDAEQYFPKWYGIYKGFEEIDFGKLPDKFVLKSNHSSGQVVICTDKEKINKRWLKNKTKKWMKENFYYVGAEPQYKNIKPRLICEELLETDIIDYRIFCFEGKPGFVRVTKHNREADSGYTANFYDIAWKEIGCLIKGDVKGDFSCPDKWKDMFCIAEKLSEKFYFVRVDLYEAAGKIYFAELTFTPNGGLVNFVPERFDQVFGEMLNLPEKNIKKEAIL